MKKQYIFLILSILFIIPTFVSANDQEMVFQKGSWYNWGNSAYYISSDTFISAKDYWHFEDGDSEFINTENWINAKGTYLIFDNGMQYNWDTYTSSVQMVEDEDGEETRWIWSPERTITLRNASLWVSEDEQYVFEDSAMFFQESWFGQMKDSDINEDTVAPTEPDEDEEGDDEENDEGNGTNGNQDDEDESDEENGDSDEDLTPAQFLTLLSTLFGEDSELYQIVSLLINLGIIE